MNWELHGSDGHFEIQDMDESRWVALVRFASLEEARKMTAAQDLYDSLKAIVGYLDSGDLEMKWMDGTSGPVNLDNARDAIDKADQLSKREDCTTCADKGECSDRVVSDLESFGDGEPVPPCRDPKGGHHSGLWTLKNLDLKTMIRELGDQGSIELISKLISRHARNASDAMKIVEESGLL